MEERERVSEGEAGCKRESKHPRVFVSERERDREGKRERGRERVGS